MNLKWKAVAAGGGIAALAAAMVWFATHRGPLAPVAVRVAPATETEIEHSVFGIGTVEARYAYSIGPTQAGRVLRLHVDHGDAVRPGQLLGEMDPVDLEQRLSGARSTLARAEQGVLMAAAQEREAQSRLKVAAANAARYRDLVQRGFVSAEAAELRDNEAAVSQAGLEAAQAALRAARNDVERANEEYRAFQKQLGNLRLTSPARGVVVSREVEPGTTVVAGQAVLRLIDPASLWVRARIDQGRAQGLKPGLAAEIVLRSDPGAVLKGRVARIDIQSDSVTEERIVQVAFDAAPLLPSLGELAEVTIRLERVPRALVVPTAALKQVDQQSGVWQIADGRTRFRPVTLGLQTLDGLTQIVDGLKAGESIIVHSTARLRDGMKVRVENAP
ncbi:MAG TPA: efflux RND transporter periplasmic adaptor subunit [Burkholderiales bacterium]|nr:efflux RND transporter periplasmic adaptor subunit [Burkholderiales bacterium]HSD99763.1 efflux RND transporter periplasmic adaptor subunit [Burkholderiales bacterium]HXV09965.1 efflux RND transporter periplasmic adaptor subunit [Burkholderiales bacterium]